MRNNPAANSQNANLQQSARLLAWWRRWRADRKIDAALAGPFAGDDWQRVARGHRVFCCTLGHGDIPAATLGTFRCGDDVYPDVPYCRSCAAVMGSDEYEITYRFADV